MEKEYAKKLLMDLKRQLKKSIEITEAENTQPDGSDRPQELSFYDNHPADIATEIFKREHDMALEQRDMDEISAINAALEKLEKGGYGTCENCGIQIEEERLKLIPYTKFCIGCEIEVSDDLHQSQPREVNALTHLKSGFREVYDSEIAERVFSPGFAGSSSTPSEVGRHRDYKGKGYTQEYELINKSQGEINEGQNEFDINEGVSISQKVDLVNEE